MKQRFTSELARTLADNEQKIVFELNQVHIGGYYHPDPALISKAMHPSTTFNAALQAVSS
ncbi:MAG: Isocitrate dehydrogenase [NADP] [Sodalis sp.]|nr:MAG: Isocitrate dehydrogenase [NADP] [Sodalis sp.]